MNNNDYYYELFLIHFNQQCERIVNMENFKWYEVFSCDAKCGVENSDTQQMAIMNFLIDNNAKLVGSRFLGLNTAYSDWDYLVESNTESIAAIDSLVTNGYVICLFNREQTPQEVIEKHYSNSSLTNRTYETSFGTQKVHIIFSEQFKLLYNLYKVCKEREIFDNSMKKEERIKIFNIICKLAELGLSDEYTLKKS